MGPPLDRVRSLVRDVTAVQVPTDETDLIDSGLIDSLTLITMIAEIEQEFQVQLALDDLDVEQFRTVQRIAQFVDKVVVALGEPGPTGQGAWSSSASQPNTVSNGIGGRDGLTRGLNGVDADPGVVGRN